LTFGHFCTNTLVVRGKKEIGPGLLKAMLKDLGLTEGDLK
jgi:predicted RNA binding protein YcfA (HicA-like mRNA interferase family)